MSEMFRGNDLFNQDISGWNPSSVTNMRETCLITTLASIQVKLQERPTAYNGTLQQLQEWMICS